MQNFKINGFSFVRAQGPDSRPAWRSDAADTWIIEERGKFGRTYRAKRNAQDLCRDGAPRKFVTPQDAAIAALA